MANPNDAVRDAILRHLYEVHRNARGPKGVAIGIRDLHRAMKAQNIGPKDVNSNLDYLLQKGWIAKIEERRTFKTTSQSDKLSEESKLNAIADIGTIQSQLSKPQPKKSIIKEAWTGIKTAITILHIREVIHHENNDISMQRLWP